MIITTRNKIIFETDEGTVKRIEITYHPDADIYEVGEVLQGLLGMMGFHRKSIKDLFHE